MRLFLLNLLILIIWGCATHASPRNATILPIFDRCPNPPMEDPQGQPLMLPPGKAAEFHKGCRRNYHREDYCAVRVIMYGPQAWGVVCGVRESTEGEK